MLFKNIYCCVFNLSAPKCYCCNFNDRAVLWVSPFEFVCKSRVELRTVPTFVSAHTFCAHASYDLSARVLELTSTPSTTPPSTRLKLKQNFPTVTKSTLMNLYLKQEHRNNIISLTCKCYRLPADNLAVIFRKFH